MRLGNSVQNLFFLKKNFLKREVGKILYVPILPLRREEKEMPSLSRLVSGVTTTLLAGSRTKGHSGKAKCSMLCVYLFKL